MRALGIIQNTVPVKGKVVVVEMRYFGGYSDPTNDANIKATTQQGGTAPIIKYQNYLAKQLPVAVELLHLSRLNRDSLRREHLRQ
jgi:hypothetical protein